MLSFSKHLYALCKKKKFNNNNNVEKICTVAAEYSEVKTTTKAVHSIDHVGCHFACFSHHTTRLILSGRNIFSCTNAIDVKNHRRFSRALGDDGSVPTSIYQTKRWKKKNMEFPAVQNRVHNRVVCPAIFPLISGKELDRLSST